MRWLEEGCLELLDQSKLPLEVTYLNCRDHFDVAAAIKRLAVRGAPAIGAAAAYGLVLGAMKIEVYHKEAFIAGVESIARELTATRPTAVNLRWAMDRLLKKLRSTATEDINELRAVLLAEANLIYREDITNNRKLGAYGQALIPVGARILTHCNAGALATAGYGTALGVIRAAHEAGKKISVYADETRPLLQGARLTTWEMLHARIPVTLITDNMAGYLMASGKVDLVIVGADRITANGDVANKIGTYSLAVLAQVHNLPFYVAAPLSTVDLDLASGEEIPIEERESVEVTHLDGRPVAPAGVKVWNPAFDVTPNRLITAIITERGVIRRPYLKNMQEVMSI
ncbi:MAG: S-methyl-5-thioribose-1-phosphate isomerase [Desulfotomaculaceae bacterium]|nr:S-methyl-5-thioribose-1-phosphate isomerase [Desulfotomaculaceae bacterium]